MTTLLEAAAAAMAGVPRQYPLNGVPASPTYPYGAHSAAFGRPYGYALDSTARAKHGRVTVQSFGRTAAAALDHMEQTLAAMLDQRLTITGWKASPMRLELEPRVIRDPDDNGVVSVTATLTFTATKET